MPSSLRTGMVKQAAYFHVGKILASVLDRFLVHVIFAAQCADINASNMDMIQSQFTADIND
jgi:hypothetical protein